MPRTKPTITSPLADRSRSPKEKSGAKSHLYRRRTKASAATLRKLRQVAKTVRKQVAQDRDQIADEARELIANAVAHGKLTKLTVLLRPDEQAVLQAIDEYATDHDLKSRNQVLRAALANLLGIDLNRPHWGWTKGRARKT